MHEKKIESNKPHIQSLFEKLNNKKSIHKKEKKKKKTQ